MKKLFISIIAVAFSLSAMAASTAAARIKLVGSNTTYAVSTLFLNEDDARNSSYESGYDAESMMSQSNPFSVLIYAYVGEHPCEYVATDDLDGQEISFTTNMVDANYTLQFSNVSGRELKLYDLVENTETTIEEGGSYAFSVEAAQVGQVEVTDRFVINYQAPTPSCTTVRSGLNVDQYYTICLPQQIASANASFWSMSNRGEGVAYLEEAAFPLTAGQPYIFQAEESTLCVVYGNAVPAAEAGAAGVLVGTFDPMAQNELSQAAADYNSPIYLLYNNELRPAAGAGNNLPANRAFIVYNNFIVENPAPAPGRRVRAIPMQTNGATAFENVDVEAAKAVKFMEDGKIFIKRGDAIYNLQGQLVK